MNKEIKQRSKWERNLLWVLGSNLSVGSYVLGRRRLYAWEGGIEKDEEKKR